VNQSPRNNEFLEVDDSNTLLFKGLQPSALIDATFFPFDSQTLSCANQAGGKPVVVHD
jgi:hypothetical protein